jgi:hypothetical protein
MSESMIFRTRVCRDTVYKHIRGDERSVGTAVLCVERIHDF